MCRWRIEDIADAILLVGLVRGQEAVEGRERGVLVRRTVPYSPGKKSPHQAPYRVFILAQPIGEILGPVSFA